MITLIKREDALTSEEVNLHCRIDWNWNYLGGTPLDVSLGIFPEGFNQEKMTSSESKQHHFSMS